MKYEYTKNTRTVQDLEVVQLVATKDFGKIKKGDLGGWVLNDGKPHLSHDGECWIFPNATLLGFITKVSGDAIVGNPGFGQPFDEILIKNSSISEEVLIQGENIKIESSNVKGDTTIISHGVVYIEGTSIQDGATIVAHPGDNVQIINCNIQQHSTVANNANVIGSTLWASVVTDRAYVKDSILRKTKVAGRATVRMCDLTDSAVTDDAVLDVCHAFCDVLVKGSATVTYTYIPNEARIQGDAIVRGITDVLVFRNTWSSRRAFTYTDSNKMWSVGCFYGTGDELIAKAYDDDDVKGQCYEAVVNYVRQIDILNSKGQTRFQRLIRYIKNMFK